MGDSWIPMSASSLNLLQYITLVTLYVENPASYKHRGRKGDLEDSVKESWGPLGCGEPTREPGILLNQLSDHVTDLAAFSPSSLL